MTRRIGPSRNPRSQSWDWKRVYGGKDMREVGFKPGVMVMVRVVIQQREKMPYRSKKRQDGDTETGKRLTARIGSWFQRQGEAYRKERSVRSLSHRGRCCWPNESGKRRRAMKIFTYKYKTFIAEEHSLIYVVLRFFFGTMCVISQRLLNARWCKAFGLAISRSRFQILLEATLRNNLRQVVHTYAPLLPSSITWYTYRPMGGDALRLGR